METIVPPHLLVIGGTGFIGHHFVKAARDEGWVVTSISLNPSSPSHQVEGVNYYQADLMDATSVRNTLSEAFDYVVNLGGYIDHTLFRNGGRRLIDAHFNGLQNLIEVLPREPLKRFVQIGSSDEYGNAAAPQHEDLREQPISPYSLGKVANTHFLQMLHRTESFPAITLRLFLTYGPGQDEKRFLPQIIKGCLSDAEFPVSDGQQLRDFCYVEDTVRVILMALLSEKAEGQVFNVGSGTPVSIRSMINMVCSIIGKGRPQYGKIPSRPGENMALYANVERTFDVLGWTPRVDLEEGLRRTIQWVQETL